MIPIGVTPHCLLNSETSYTYDSYLIKGLKELLTPFYKSPIHVHYPNSNQNPLNLVNPIKTIRIKTLPLQDSRQPSRFPPSIFRKNKMAADFTYSAANLLIKLSQNFRGHPLNALASTSTSTIGLAVSNCISDLQLKKAFHLIFERYLLFKTTF